MPIPCPGSASYNHTFGVGRRGPTPFHAFIGALIVLIWEIANSGLRKFLETECADGCEKTVTGPAFSNFYASVKRHPQGGWNCVLGVVVDARIDCRHEDGPAIDASDEAIGQGLVALLKAGDGKAQKKRA